MRSLCGAYVQAINKQQDRHGPLFQGRFRAIWVDEEPYFVGLARYIHANPVLAGLAESCADWPYSNYLDIIGRRKGTLKNGDLVPGRYATGTAYEVSIEDYIAFRREVRGLARYLLE